MMERTHVFDAKLQKERLSKYKDSKNKSQKYTKVLTDKKALITIIFGQCDEATKTKIALGATYAIDRQARRLIKFLNWLCTVGFGSNDGGLSYRPYKQVLAVKLMNNYTNNKLHSPYGLKEQVKFKYEATKTPNYQNYVWVHLPNHAIMVLGSKANVRNFRCFGTIKIRSLFLTIVQSIKQYYYFYLA